MDGDRERAVLQHLAMEGIAEVGDVADAAGLGVDEAGGLLEDLAEAGYVEEEGFWYVTPEGEERLAELCRARFSEPELDRLREVFDGFEELDARVKALASEWQDGGGDELVAELADLHAEVEALFDRLDPGARAVYEPYLESLAGALAQLRDGNGEYFTGTEVDSYHDVWFSLHDDLLRTLGEERTG